MGERKPSSLTRAPLGTGCKTRQPIKMNTGKERKRGKCSKWGERAIDVLCQTERKYHCLDPLFATAGVGFMLGMRQVTCFARTTERAKKESQHSLNRPRSLWSQIKPTSSITNSKALLVSFSSLSLFTLGKFLLMLKGPSLRLKNKKLKHKFSDGLDYMKLVFQQHIIYTNLKRRLHNNVPVLFCFVSGHRFEIVERVLETISVHMRQQETPETL